MFYGDFHWFYEIVWWWIFLGTYWDVWLGCDGDEFEWLLGILRGFMDMFEGFYGCLVGFDSPPARWGLLDFMSVACSSPPLLSSSSCSTATLDAQCSLSDLNHDHPRPVPCRTSTTTIPAQCSLPDLNHDHPRPVFPAGPQPRVSTPSVPCRTSCRMPEDMPDRMSDRMPEDMPDKMPWDMPDRYAR